MTPFSNFASKTHGGHQIGFEMTPPSNFPPKTQYPMYHTRYNAPTSGWKAPTIGFRGMGKVFIPPRAKSA